MTQTHEGDETATLPVEPTSAQQDAWRSAGSYVRVVLRPVASPTSLGLFGLAAATFTVSGLQLGWVAPIESRHAALVLVGFAAPAQLIACLTAFVARAGTVATVMGVLSLTWLSMGLVLLTSSPAARSSVVGLLLLSSAVAVGLGGVTALWSKLGAAVVFLTAALRLALTGAFQLTGSPWLQDTAGIVGLVLFVMAVYVAWASELEDATGDTVLPVGRRGKGRTALHGPLSEQIASLPHEPGIRTRL